jgi:bifunctional enzyme CysN/CysC
LDFALLVDGLAAEREQGITIDVAYRFFATKRRKFIVADTPGHSEYTRNMATGASTATLAVILIDASSGIMEQTRRHSIICQWMGIRQIILAVNKMDLVNYDEAVFAAISSEYEVFAAPLGFDRITPIALSALRGDNITSRSSKMRWHNGPTLISKLETMPLNLRQPQPALPCLYSRLTVPDARFWGYNGEILSAPVHVGDEVRIAAQWRHFCSKENLAGWN